MRLQAIIFDIDGTLIDSNDIHAECWREAFAKFGKSIELDTIRHQIGKGGDLLVPDLLNAREMRKFGEDLREYRGDLFKKKYMKTIKPFPRIRETLRSLEVPFAFASSANADEVEYYVELVGAGDLVKATTSTDDAEFSKPSPEIFEAALEKLGTDVARTLVVGDTPYDILAAHRASLAIAAVSSGGFERELLEKAEFLYRDVEEIVRNLDKIDDYFSKE